MLQIHSKNTLGRVMLIDDDGVDRMACKRLLSGLEIAEELYCFSDAETALQRLESGECHAADVILLDVNMPRMNGLEFLQAAQASKKFHLDSKVGVMISVNLTDSQQDAFERTPCVKGFVRKPLTHEDLLSSGLMHPSTK